MTTNLTTLDAIYKRNYNEGSQVLINQQNLNAPCWGKIPVSPLKPSPQGAYTPVTMDGNETGGAIWEEQGFEEPESVNPQQPNVKAKLVIWPFKITGSAIRYSENNKVAFATALNSQQKDNMARMFSDLNRMGWGTGTGQITLANGAGNGATALVVDDPFAFRKNMYIDAFATLGGAKEISGVKITAVNYATKTLTLASAQTWSDNAIICKRKVMDGVSAGNYKEIMGFRGICDTTIYDTTFEGLAVSAQPDWVGNVINGAGAPISQDLLQQNHNRLAIVAGETPDTLVSNYGQARTFLNDELDKTRYDSGEVKAGNIVLRWGKLEWIVDHTFSIGEVGMYVKRHWEKFQTKDVSLSDLPGQGLYQIVGKDAVGGYYVYQGNTGTWKRNAFARIKDLLEPDF